MVLIRSTSDYVDSVAENNRELAALKTTNHIAADSLRTYHHRKPDGHDLAVAISPRQNRRFIVRFTGSRPERRHIIHCAAFMRVGSSDVLASPQSNYYPTMPEVSFSIKKRAVKRPNVHEWALRVDHNLDTSQRTAFFKFLFSGSDTGEFTVREV